VSVRSEAHRGVAGVAAGGQDLMHIDWELALGAWEDHIAAPGGLVDGAAARIVDGQAPVAGSVDDVAGIADPRQDAQHARLKLDHVHGGEDAVGVVAAGQA
jgi:hypothetical protein